MQFFRELEWFDIVVAVFLGFWLVVSALYQIKRFKWVGWLKSRDFFAMIPAWSFFAPNPGMTDLHLLYREKLNDGTVTNWRQIRWDARLIRAFWNPHKRLQKGISDMGNDLHRYAARNKDHAERVLIYPSFIALLRYISEQKHTPGTERVQFTIARSFGYHSEAMAQVQFVSNFHRI